MKGFFNIYPFSKPFNVLLKQLIINARMNND